MTEIVPTAELVLWSKYGLYGEGGWRRLRIPIRSFRSPTKIQLKANVPINNFITISNTKLIDKDGNEIGCGEFYAISFQIAYFIHLKLSILFSFVETDNELNKSAKFLRDFSLFNYIH